MRLLLAVCISLLLTVQAWAGGAIAFDGDDYYTCPAVSLGASSPNNDRISLMAYVTPDFSSSDTTTQYVVSQAEIVGCPPLPPFCMGSICGSGFIIRWVGSASAFAFRFGETGRCGSGINTFIGCSTGSVTFSAGDLIGLYAWFNDNVQQCEAFIPAGTGGQGSAFVPFVKNNYTGEDLHIGAANPAQNGGAVGAYWNGSIDMIILGNGRVAAIDNNRLVDVHKRSWKPMWQGTYADSGSGGTAAFEPVFSTDMMDGAIGATVSTLNSASASCTATGDPTATTTTMMY